MHSVLSPDALARALAIRDLSDPAQGPHAMQRFLDQLVAGVAGDLQVNLQHTDPRVSIADNYDRLLYSQDAITRDARYSRYVDPDHLLRSHTSAMIPRALAELAACPWGELLLVRPGLVYRKDAIDRLHTGEPHQVDLWHLRRGEPPLEEADLMQLIARAVEAALPGARWRTTPAVHPYTLAGRQIDVECGRSWIEIGECGLAHPEVLAILEKGTVVCPPKGLGLAKGTVVCPPRGSGLAMGLGLDRLLMLRKGIDDIRLLRAEDPRIARQLLDLEPYRRVSVMPPIRRDLSIAVAAGTGDEDLGAEVRAALGADAAAVEEIAIVSRTHAAALPPAAIARMGIGRDQENVLLRVVLRHPDRTLTHAEANALRDRIYAAVHRGSRMEWAG